MAALTRAGQGSSPSSASNSPRHRGHGRGQMDRNTPSHPNTQNDQTGLEQTALVHSVTAGCGTWTTGQSQGNGQGSKDSQGGTSNRKDISSLQYFRCQGWGHMVWEFAPHWHQPQQPTVGSQHSLPDPKPKLTILKVAQKKG